MQNMSSKERVRTAFAHREPDRVPLFELSVDTKPASALMGREMWVGEYGYNSVRANRMAVEGAGGAWEERFREDTLELWHAVGLDLLAFPRPGRREKPIIETLGEYEWRITDPLTGLWEIFTYTPDGDMYGRIDSTLNEAALNDAGEEAFEKYVTALEQIPYRPEDYDLESLDRWVEGGRDLFLLIASDVIFPATSRSWGALFLELMIARPDLIDRYLDAQLKERLLIMDEAFKRGVDGVLAGADWASSVGPLISPAFFQRFIVPRLRRIVDLCHAHRKVIVKHTDGNIRRLEAILFDECQVDGFHPIDPTVGLTVADYKQRFGDRITLLGNVDCARTLVRGTPEQVIAETKAILRDGAPGGGFVLSSSNSIHAGVKPELWQAMLETAREYGVYPIGNGEADAA